jgi:endonuclease/exonuclease/phosphatase (EEP) superfamily protein YafD
VTEPVRRLGAAAAHVVVVGYVLAGVLAFVPAWPLSLIEHFRVQYLLVGIAVVGCAVLGKRFFDAALIAWLVNLAIVAPDLGASAHEKAGTHVRMVFSNVLSSNRSFDKVAAVIRENQPDLVALVEMRDPWFAELAPALAGYEKLEHGRDDNFGLALYVRGSLHGRVEYFGETVPTIVAAIETRGVTATVIVTHPMPPVDKWAQSAQGKHLAELAGHVTSLRGPLVLVGDLNATPWSRYFRRLVGTTGLCDSRAGFGYQGSYPASSTVLRIPIDHVLVSCDIGVRDRRIGPDVGSDHLPVIVDLTF